MYITVLKFKVSYAAITHCDLFYEGSITIDEDIMDKAGMKEFEQVHVVNVSNGERLTTYAIKGERGSKVIGLNGPAARKGIVGDFVHILAYVQIESDQSIEPTILNLKNS
jgi:aspartate 1-decarboxylase